MAPTVTFNMANMNLDARDALLSHRPDWLKAKLLQCPAIKMHYELTGSTHPSLVDKNLALSKKHEELKLPAINATQKEKPLSAVRESSGPFPFTTAQLIGTKSTRGNWKLEKYGGYPINSRGQIGGWALPQSQTYRFSRHMNRSANNNGIETNRSPSPGGESTGVKAPLLRPSEPLTPIEETSRPAEPGSDEQEVTVRAISPEAANQSQSITSLVDDWDVEDETWLDRVISGVIQKSVLSIVEDEKKEPLRKRMVKGIRKLRKAARNIFLCRGPTPRD